MARFTITRAQAAAFAIRATTLVEAGRPPVPAVRRPPRPFRTRVPADQRPPAPRYLTLLAEGEVEIVGRMPWSSNRTFLATCALGRRRRSARCTSPGAASGSCGTSRTRIYRREVAAYELSCALGWDLVPETVERDDAPLGPGSLQRFVDADFSQHHFTLVEDEDNHDQAAGRSAPSTSWPTTPTARAGTACSAKTDDLGHRQRAVASTPSPSCAR